MKPLVGLSFIITLGCCVLFDSNALWKWLLSDEFRLIKVGPESYKAVTEVEKLQLRRSFTNFIDVTDHVPINDAFKSQTVGKPSRGLFDWLLFLGSKQIKSLKKKLPSYKYPVDMAHEAAVQLLISRINRNRMFQNLSRFTSFYTRYYKSKYGLESANWLYEQIAQVVKPVEDRVYLSKVDHNGWEQFSIVLTIPGETKDKVIVGAHQDSLNLLFPSTLKAPGADDNGSGCVTILEAMIVLLDEYSKNRFKTFNTLEFHFYSAEEGGLLGSMDIFNDYYKNEEVVLGMLQQDMTGFTASTTDNGEEKHFGLVKDYTSIALNEFLKKLIEKYTILPYHETECGYACSDHASAIENGFPSSLVVESEFKYTSRFAHSTMDTIDRLDWDHMHEHVKLTIAYLYELGMAQNLYTTS